MDVPLTAKQEAFAFNIAVKQMSQHDAYMGAYNTKSMLPATIDRSAHDLATLDKITARVEQLLEKHRTPDVMDYQERQRILTELGRGNLLDYQETGADGGYLSVGKDSPNTRAISEITSRTEYDKNGSGAALVTKLKLHNPIQAISELNKMDGSYPAAKIDLDFGKPFKELLDRLQGRREVPQITGGNDESGTEGSS